MTEPAATPAPPLPSATLAAALRVHGLALPSGQVECLDRYCRLLWEWNERLNLTRHVDYDKFVARDVIDSVQLSRLLNAGESVLDVGTGGGVPGVVLAILRPELRVTLCESVGKKARAVASIVQELKLPVPVLPHRAEEILPEQRFDVLVARAVGPLPKLCRWFEPHWKAIGRMLVVKGPSWPEELEQAIQLGFMDHLEIRCSAEYPMPGTESNSVILKLWLAGRPEPA